MSGRKKNANKIARFFTTKHENQVTALISKLWKDKTYADVTLLAGGKEFLVHRTVLSLSSSLISAALADITRDPVILLDDTAPEDLTSALEIIYCGETKGAVPYKRSVLDLLTRLGVKALVTTSDQPNRGAKLDEPSTIAELPPSTEVSKKWTLTTQREKPKISFIDTEDCRDVSRFNCTYCRKSYSQPGALFEHIKVCAKPSGQQENKASERVEQGNPADAGNYEEVVAAQRKKNKMRSKPSEEQESQIKEIDEHEHYANGEIDEEVPISQRKRRKKEIFDPSDLKIYPNVDTTQNCHLCSKVFENTWLYKMHKESHCEQYPSVCNHCKMKVNLTSYVKHLLHNLKMHCDSQCPVCQTHVTGDSKAMRLHVIQHLPEELMKIGCGICSEKFLTVRDQLAHSKTVRHSEPALDVPLNSSCLTSDAESVRFSGNTVRVVKPKITAVPYTCQSKDNSNSLTSHEARDKEELLSSVHSEDSDAVLSLQICEVMPIRQDEPLREVLGGRGCRSGRPRMSRGGSYFASGGSPRGRGKPRKSAPDYLTYVQRGSTFRGRRRGQRGGRTRGSRTSVGSYLSSDVPRRGRGRPRMTGELAPESPTDENSTTVEMCVVCTASLSANRRTSMVHKRACWSKLFHWSGSTPSISDTIICEYCKTIIVIGYSLENAVNAHYTAEECPLGFRLRSLLVEDVTGQVVDNYDDSFLIEIDHADQDDVESPKIVNIAAQDDIGCTETARVVELCETTIETANPDKAFDVQEIETVDAVEFISC